MSIGGYRTHVDQQVLIDRCVQGYVMWMYDEEDDVWEDHVEIYEPMASHDLTAHFAHPGDANHYVMFSDG